MKIDFASLSFDPILEVERDGREYSFAKAASFAPEDVAEVMKLSKDGADGKAVYDLNFDMLAIAAHSAGCETSADELREHFRLYEVEYLLKEVQKPVELGE